MYVKKSIKLFSIFSTAQKLPKIFMEFFGKCKIFHEKINEKHFNLLYAVLTQGQGQGQSEDKFGMGLQGLESFTATAAG